MEKIIFNCNMCGDCCKGYGGTYVSEADIAGISEFIGADPENFVSEYCVLSGGRPMLAQAESGFCFFWDGACTIHPVKPLMCRSWPFIRSVLADISNWFTMAESCPGMRINVGEDEIRSTVERELLSSSDCP